MTLGELIAHLDGLLDEGLLATQPSWPLQFRCSGVAGSDLLHGDEDDQPVLGDEERAVWLVEGGHPFHPYAPRGL